MDWKLDEHTAFEFTMMGIVLGFLTILLAIGLAAYWGTLALMGLLR